MLKGLFLFTVLILLTSVKHPIKLTSSMVSYDENSDILTLECRVFIDDFEDSLNTKMNSNVNVSELYEEDKLVLEKYFNTYYNISINGERLILNYSASEVLFSQNIFNVKFVALNVSIKEGDDFLIENMLFLEEFGSQQENMITIVFPPYFAEFNYKTDITNYRFSHSF